MRIGFVCSVALVISVSWALAAHPSRADNRATIKALENQFTAAVRAKDLDGIMKVYARGGDLRVTDLYRKVGGDWRIVHEHVSVPVKLDMTSAL